MSKAWLVPIVCAVAALMDWLDRFLERHAVNVDEHGVMQSPRRLVTYGVIREDGGRVERKYWLIRLHWSLAYQREFVSGRWYWHERQIIWRQRFLFDEPHRMVGWMIHYERCAWEHWRAKRPQLVERNGKST